MDIFVYNICLLLEVIECLFGCVKECCFFVFLGVYVLGGSRKVVVCGFVWVWFVIGLVILKDCSKGVCLFVKDVGIYGDDLIIEGEVIGFLEGIFCKVINSIVFCGED